MTTLNDFDGHLALRVWRWMKWFYRANLWCFGFRVKNCMRFFGAVWHWDSCDYAPTLRLMEIGFRGVSESHKKGQIVVDADRIARDTLVVAELCRRLQADDYADLAGYANISRMTDAQRRRWALHTTYLAEQDARYLGHVLRKVRCWWH